MDVHDVGEPGIYIPAERLRIRIEDDILVTENGHEILSAGAPRSAEEVEKVMAEENRAGGRRP